MLPQRRETELNHSGLTSAHRFSNNLLRLCNQRVRCTVSRPWVKMFRSCTCLNQQLPAFYLSASENVKCFCSNLWSIAVIMKSYKKILRWSKCLFFRIANTNIQNVRKRMQKHIPWVRLKFYLIRLWAYE